MKPIISPLNSSNDASPETAVVQLWPDDTGLFFITLRSQLSQLIIMPEKSTANLWPVNSRTNLYIISEPVSSDNQKEAVTFWQSNKNLIEPGAKDRTVPALLPAKNKKLPAILVMYPGKRKPTREKECRNNPIIVNRIHKGCW